ncbi:hypothetical protein A9A59_2352 [Tepidiforma thermophila]|uniref:Uncharacterized protein n=1 Tax=Tepidiforma thermophila (strain KCTC 52669 / CGMCC 1.13589 / G233) TaxID=2761530 RepID=A0A2A9HGD3_TEPT2|nr:hypothetical protein A9A59_2352 [Tepidiforma thermophila]
MRRLGILASGGMLVWCALEIGLRAATGTLDGAGSALSAGAAASVSTLLLWRAG